MLMQSPLYTADGSLLFKCVVGLRSCRRSPVESWHNVNVRLEEADLLPAHALGYLFAEVLDVRC